MLPCKPPRLSADRRGDRKSYCRQLVAPYRPDATAGLPPRSALPDASRGEQTGGHGRKPDRPGRFHELVQDAWRNTWRGQWRTLVTISATAFGLLMIMLYSALVEGYLESMERILLDMELGDIQIHTLRFRDDPSLYESIEAPRALLERIEEMGVSATPRPMGSGLAAAGEASAGVSLRGVEHF